MTHTRSSVRTMSASATAMSGTAAGTGGHGACAKNCSQLRRTARSTASAGRKRFRAMAADTALSPRRYRCATIADVRFRFLPRRRGHLVTVCPQRAQRRRRPPHLTSVPPHFSCIFLIHEKCLKEHQFFPMDAGIFPFTANRISAVISRSSMWCSGNAEVRNPSPFSVCDIQYERR